MNKTLKLFALSLGLAFGSAQAGTITIGGTPAGSEGQISSIGSCTVNFNDGTANNSCGATYTNTVTGNFVTGSATALYAAPVGDTSGYLAVSPSSGSQSITITLAQAANYFGFYSGSLDAYNLVQFYLGNTLVDSFTGSDINVEAFDNQASGNQGQAAYVNYFPTTGNVQQLFDKVVYSSTDNAFETDNHSFAIATAPAPVPEPGSIALMGLAALGMFSARRRKQG